MKAHEYWSVGALITMLGTFYSGYKGSKSSHKYFAASSLLCMIMAIQCLLIKQLSVTSNSYICSGHARIGTDAKEHKVFASES